MLAVRHGSIPEWRGFVYNGRKADGVPNGFARSAGRTQLSGFENGAHAVADLGSRPWLSTGTSVTVLCDTIVRRSPSIDGQKLGTVSKGATAKATGTEPGSHWSGCGKEGTTWRRVTAINGRSTSSLYGRAYAYIAAGLTTSPAQTIVRTDLWSKDPNHNSASRPENPAYDVISKQQAARMYADHTTKLGRLPYGAIPTRSFL
jgi:hypothetical protein